MNANLTQEKSGVSAGLVKTSAYSPLSHYENGVYKPMFELACAFAKGPDVPECYFYIIDNAFVEKSCNYIVMLMTQTIMVQALPIVTNPTA
ncbi:transcriptional regulator [Pantoea sp. App145]|uniref:transcriptional regulator n=1 Tax=Pantoea sp. App145 TaxID=3071567 RepID=UPI003A7FCA37